MQSLQRILYVEDDPDIQQIAVMVLETIAGFTLKACSSGAEALQHAIGFQPDLILLDVMMPGMDGLEATRRIREDARFQKLPIIAITAKAMKDDQEQCIKAGASDYLAKPIDIDRLYSLLRVWMPTMERI